MVRTIFWYIGFWGFMILSVFLTIPLFFLFLPGFKRAREKYINIIVSWWAKYLLLLAGGKIKVQGLKNIPPHKKICFVANHQGAFDIPIILGYLPLTPGFIAKKELLYIPLVNMWMYAIGCIFINRSNRRASLSAIERGVTQLQSERPMILFPEGTRSKCSKMNNFKPGSLKMPIRAKATIVPVTISGSYKMKEARNGLITPAHVKLIIHAPVETKGMTEQQTYPLAASLSSTISSVA